MRSFSCLTLVLLALCFGATVAAEESPSPPPSAEELLSSMIKSLRQTQYSGEFTYEHGSRLESYRIVHLYNEGAESEYLFRLTGREQSFLKSGHSECGTIGGQLIAGARLTSSNGTYYGLDRYYRIKVLGRDRVAGRNAWVVQLAPRDEFRFGFVLTIDDASRLLLRQVVFDARKSMALERTQYISIDFDYDPVETPAMLEVKLENCVEDTFTPNGRSPWQPTWLPTGYVRTSYSYMPDEGHMESYTDGISSFSVFVRPSEAVIEADNRVRQAVSTRGANMALVSTRLIDGKLQEVSVVGEVPLSVAQKVALSMKGVPLSESGS